MEFSVTYQDGEVAEEQKERKVELSVKLNRVAGKRNDVGEEDVRKDVRKCVWNFR